MPLPAWREHRTQPIDGRDVIAYLVAAGTSDVVDGPLSLDIAGPDVVTYAALIERIRDALLVGRPRVNLPHHHDRRGQPRGRRDRRRGPGPHRAADGQPGDRPAAARRPRRASCSACACTRFDAAIERALRDWEAVEELAAR